MEQFFVTIALVISIFAAVVSYKSYQKSEREAGAKAAEREAKINEQIACWQRGEIEAKWEPCINNSIRYA